MSQLRVAPFLKEPSFSNPFILYTCNDLFSKLNQQIKELDITKIPTSNESLLCSIVTSMRMLPNHIGTVYRGVRKFKHSSLDPPAAVGSVINWRGFTSTSKKESKAM